MRSCRDCIVSFLHCLCCLFDEWMVSDSFSWKIVKDGKSCVPWMITCMLCVWWYTCSLSSGFLFHLHVFSIHISCHRLVVVIHSTSFPIDSGGSRYSTGIGNRESFDSLAEYYNRERLACRLPGRKRKEGWRRMQRERENHSSEGEENDRYK